MLNLSPLFGTGMATVLLSSEPVEPVEPISDAASIVVDSVSKTGVGQVGPIWVKIVSVAIIIIFAIIICKISHKLLNKYIIESDSQKITGTHITSANLIYTVLKYVLVLFTIIVIMDIIGINITGFVAGFGIIGAVVGLAAQDLLKDLIAGTNIASEKYFAIGDVIECKNYIGKVVSVSMRSTKIKTYDGSVVTIQNHLIDSAKLMSPNGCINISLGYDLSREKAYEMLDRIVDRVKTIPEITDVAADGIADFEDSSISYFLRFSVSDAFGMPGIKRKINVIVMDELDKEGIEIPFKQIDIHQK